LKSQIRERSDGLGHRVFLFERTTTNPIASKNGRKLPKCSVLATPCIEEKSLSAFSAEVAKLRWTN